VHGALAPCGGSGSPVKTITACRASGRWSAGCGGRVGAVRGQARVRLVGEQHDRVVDHRAGQRRPPQLLDRQVRRPPVGRVGDLEPASQVSARCAASCSPTPANRSGSAVVCARVSSGRKTVFWWTRP